MAINVRIFVLAFLACSTSGCAIEKIADGGPSMTRSVKVPTRDVAVYANALDVPGRYTVVEEIWVSDDGRSLPTVLERDLRAIAGARGANAVILASTNRKLNGTRIDTQVQLDNPFDYFAGTAVWVGEGVPTMKVVRQ